MHKIILFQVENVPVTQRSCTGLHKLTNVLTFKQTAIRRKKHMFRICISHW